MSEDRPSAPAPEASGAPEAPDATAREGKKVQVSCSPGFLEWLAAEGIGVAFTTYQTNRLFLVGRDDGGRLAAFERLLDRPMGLAVTAERLWLATRFQLWRFDQVLSPEDRCHLNGLALDGGRPRFVTAVARTDEAQGWRAHRADGGVVLDVESGEVVASGLSMPHSPRLLRGELYVLDSGHGDLGRVDLASGRFEPIAFCPGYLRGLAFRGGAALVGLSKPRDRTFRDLPLDGRLAQAGAEPRCALWVIDLATGKPLHWLEVHGVVLELYDVAVVPDAVRPMALGFKSDGGAAGRGGVEGGAGGGRGGAGGARPA